MSVLEQIKQLINDDSITDSDKLYSIALGDYHKVILYETKSDYLYMAEVMHGKVIELTTYEYKGVQEL